MAVKTHVRLLRVFSGLIVTTAFLLPGGDRNAASAAEEGSRPWTFNEARAQLRLNPDDPYLQYVVLQLGRKAGRLDAVREFVESLTPRNRMGRTAEVDLFDIFSGALAVQESLQLDTMRNGGEEEAALRTVNIKTLSGPTVKSHPWKKMLNGRDPDVSELSMCVPADQYFVRFDSLNRLLQVLDLNNDLGTHLVTHATRTAREARVGDRLKTQLAVVASPLTRPFYDLVVDEVAVTGSDLYVREGSDVTLLFRFRREPVFRLRMDGFLSQFEAQVPNTIRSEGSYHGVRFVHLTSPGREVHVFSAYPRDGLHIRSNSRVGLARAIDAIKGESPDGVAVERLGETDEFRYIRTLMPHGDELEDGLVYLSDAFIRRQTGPVVKLTERRRMIAYNHLRMISHASLLFRTQFGKPPKSLRELGTTGMAPGIFGEGSLACPSGGTYSLSEDGLHGVSSVYGHALHLVPCCEVPVWRVSKQERDEYKRFVTGYEQYWRTFFDPIAIRIRITPQQYRFETIVLPLINNTIYTALSSVIAGEPEPLDELPVPKRNVFSMAMKLNKPLVMLASQVIERDLSDGIEQVLGVSNREVARSVNRFLKNGIGNQVGFHIYDCDPTFDFDLTSFLGQTLGSGNRGFLNNNDLPLVMLVSSLNTPVYVSMPVQNAQIVDDFLDQVDALLALASRRPPEGWWFQVEHDFFTSPIPGTDRKMRGYALKFGPIKFRFFWARIGDGLYIASKPFILDDLIALNREREQAPSDETQPARDNDRMPRAQAMVRIRAENWDRIRSSFELGWSDSSRQASLNNLSLLTNVGRAWPLSADPERPELRQAQSRAIIREAEAIYGCRFFCPNGGRFELAPTGHEFVSTAHGTILAPRQDRRPSENGPLGRALKKFRGATAELSFLEDGLHAVLTIDRK